MCPDLQMNLRARVWNLKNCPLGTYFQISVKFGWSEKSEVLNDFGFPVIQFERVGCTYVSQILKDNMYL